MQRLAVLQMAHLSASVTSLLSSARTGMLRSQVDGGEEGCKNGDESRRVRLFYECGQTHRDDRAPNQQ